MFIIEYNSLWLLSTYNSDSDCLGLVRFWDIFGFLDLHLESLGPHLEAIHRLDRGLGALCCGVRDKPCKWRLISDLWWNKGKCTGGSGAKPDDHFILHNIQHWLAICEAFFTHRNTLRGSFVCRWRPWQRRLSRMVGMLWRGLRQWTPGAGGRWTGCWPLRPPPPPSASRCCRQESWSSRLKKVKLIK